MSTKAKNLKSFMRAKVSEMDENHLDPGGRAELVNSFIFHALGLEDPKEIIEQPLYWDLLCYNMEMLSLYAVNMEDENLILAVKYINNYMYSLHYSGEVDVDSFLGPGKIEHEDIWVRRSKRVLKADKNGL
jgi:hypothetical protein